jgi:pyruvyltransferase
MKVYYWKGKPNFGDAIAPLLLKRWAQKESEWAPAAESSVVITGSIIEHLPHDYHGVILGAGLMYDRPGYIFPRSATVLAVRGPLTARSARKSGHKDFVLGDPGLLADELIPLPYKTHNLGILPHWTDTELAQRPEFLKYDPLIINPMDDPLRVISEIGRCRKLVTSSLHGVILADAFGIPRRTELAPRLAAGLEGGVFKFKDYNASVGVDFEVGLTQEAPRHRVEDRQHELWDAFRKLKFLAWERAL